MKLYELFTHLSAGGILSIIIVLSYLIEVSPIKINPIGALGKMLNKNVMERLDKTEKHVDLIERKLDDHVVSSLRSKILSFMDDILERRQLKTRSQWSEILKACTEYENYISTNGLMNGDATEAIEFLHSEYQRCCNTGSFLDLKNIKRNNDV